VLLHGEDRHVYDEDIPKTWKHTAQRRGNTSVKGVYLYWPCGSGWHDLPAPAYTPAPCETAPKVQP